MCKLGIDLSTLPPTALLEQGRRKMNYNKVPEGYVAVSCWCEQGFVAVRKDLVGETTTSCGKITCYRKPLTSRKR